MEVLSKINDAGNGDYRRSTWEPKGTQEPAVRHWRETGDNRRGIALRANPAALLRSRLIPVFFTSELRSGPASLSVRSGIELGLSLCTTVPYHVPRWITGDPPMPGTYPLFSPPNHDCVKQYGDNPPLCVDRGCPVMSAHGGCPMTPIPPDKRARIESFRATAHRQADHWVDRQAEVLSARELPFRSTGRFDAGNEFAEPRLHQDFTEFHDHVPPHDCIDRHARDLHAFP